MGSSVGSMKVKSNPRQFCHHLKYEILFPVFCAADVWDVVVNRHGNTAVSAAVVWQCYWLDSVARRLTLLDCRLPRLHVHPLRRIQ